MELVPTRCMYPYLIKNSVHTALVCCVLGVGYRRDDVSSCVFGRAQASGVNFAGGFTSVDTFGPGMRFDGFDVGCVRCNMSRKACCARAQQGCSLP